MLSLYEILKASKTGIAPDMWTALAGMNWGGKDSGAEVKELTGIPPLSFTADGTPLLDYLISGNMSQTGTPTPDNPIMPQGTGDLETVGAKAGQYKIPISSGGANLAWTGWVEDFVQRINNSTQAYINNDILSIIANVGHGEYDTKYIFKAEWKENTQYTFNLTYRRDSTYSNATVLQITYTDGTTTTFPRTINDGEWHNIYVTSKAGKTIKYLNALYTSNWLEIKIDSFFVYEGTVEKPYEPYIEPTETNIYLGEVETTRKINKLVLTGKEYWQLWKGNYFSSVIDRKGAIFNIVCSHFINSYTDGISYDISSTSGLKIAAAAVPFVTSASELMAWIAAQYAAGTPVTVWYVLAKPETAVVNEPLRKIGDYADTLSMEQAGVSIPTLNGQTVIDVDTTLKPSQMYIKYKR